MVYCIFLTFKMHYLWKPYYEEIRNSFFLFFLSFTEPGTKHKLCHLLQNHLLQIIKIINAIHSVHHILVKAMLFISVSKGVRVHITILRLVVYNFFILN